MIYLSDNNVNKIYLIWIKEWNEIIVLFYFKEHENELEKLKQEHEEEIEALIQGENKIKLN